MMYRKIGLGVAASALCAAAFGLFPVAVPRASAATISCVHSDGLWPLKSGVPDVSVTSYTIVRYVDTDLVPNCETPVVATYAINVVLKDVSVSQLSSANIDCSIYSSTGLLRGHVAFTLSLPAMNPGDSSSSGDNEDADFEPGDHLKCTLTKVGNQSS